MGPSVRPVGTGYFFFAAGFFAAGFLAAGFLAAGFFAAGFFAAIYGPLLVLFDRHLTRPLVPPRTGLRSWPRTEALAQGY